MSSTILVDVSFPTLLGESVFVPMIVTTDDTFTEEEVSSSQANVALKVATVINTEDPRFHTAEIVMDGFMAKLVVDTSSPDDAKPNYVSHLVTPVCLLTDQQASDLANLIGLLDIEESK